MATRTRGVCVRGSIEAVALWQAATAKGRPPKRMIELFSPATEATFRNVAGAFKIYAQLPEVLAMAALR